MAYTPTTDPGFGLGFTAGTSATTNGAVIKERVKSVSYHATDHKLILDVEADQTVGSVKEGTIGDLRIKNTGNHPAFAILAYRLWTTATDMEATTFHLNCLLKPG